MLQLSKFRIGIFLATMIVTVVAVPTAQAQRRNMGGLRPGNASPARLLPVESVQVELKLTDQQKEKAAEINEMLTAGRHELFATIKKDSKERGPKAAELERKAHAGIDELLDDAQEKRLKELLLQVNGASELSRKEIREALKITKEQQKKLAEIRRSNMKARQEALENYEGDRMQKSVELLQEADKKLLEVLTDEQRKQFESMKGKKITIELFSA